MARIQMTASLLRPALALLAIAGLLTLAGCGGGSGAPNNPFAPVPPTPGPITVSPPSVTVYANTPATLTIGGGSPPYQAFSSNSAALPLPQAVSGSTVVLLPGQVAANTAVTVTIQDSIGSTPATATVTVNPAQVFNTLTITPARTTCGTNAICSGDTATALIQVLGPGGVGVPNRQVKFDVVSGAYGIMTTNPAAPVVPTQTVVSDNNGNAQVILLATVNAPTQSAVLRATDLTTGQSVTAVFTIVQSTNGTGILSVTPPTATITGAFTNSCSAGFRTDYYIYGGTPPYHVSSTFPTAVTLLNSIVTSSGSFFSAITNGTCVNPLVFTIVDATGRQITATLINQPGTAAPPTPPTPTALAVAGPSTLTGCTTSTTFSFVITGGTPPYNFSAALNSGTPAYNPLNQMVNAAGGTFSVSGLATSSSGTVAVVDSGAPSQSVTKPITCSP